MYKSLGPLTDKDDFVYGDFYGFHVISSRFANVGAKNLLINVVSIRKNGKKRKMKYVDLKEELEAQIGLRIGFGWLRRTR